MPNGVPKSVAEADRGLDELMAGLEKGEIPSPEVTAPTQEDPVVPEPVVETVKDTNPTDELQELTAKLEKADQRFRTLEGMMKAGQKRSSEIISGLEQQITETKVEQVQAPLDLASILTEEETSEFGESGIAVLQKLAGAIAEREVAKKALEVEQQLEEMRKRVDHAEASTEGNTTWDQVEQINPGAKKINASDAGWFAFLATADPVSGTLYRDIGEAAAGVNDISRLSGLIDLYRLSANLAKPKIPVKPKQGNVTPNNDGNRSTVKGEKRSYSQDEVREFYENMARGRRHGITAGLPPEKLEALGADIDAAMEEGRIIL